MDRSFMNLIHISAEIGKTDPILAYDLERSASILARDLPERVVADRIALMTSVKRMAGQEGRPDFLLDLKPDQKKLTHPSDKIFITYYNGWSWTHTNTDGRGTHDTTRSRITPSRMVDLIDRYIVPSEEASEAREYFSSLAESGMMEKGADVSPGPSTLPSAEKILSEMSPLTSHAPIMGDYNPVFSTVRLCSILINVAHSHPELRSKIVPIVAQYVFDRS